MRIRPTVLLLVLSALCAGAHAQDWAAARKQYSEMCQKLVDVPTDMGGDADLKGNPKLASYCDCVAGPWVERTKKAAAGAPPMTVQQTDKEDLAIRTTCRKKEGLPPPPTVKPR